MKYSKVLLTGATGWFGRRLARTLMLGEDNASNVGKKNIQLKCLVQPNEDATFLSDMGCTIVRGDVTNTDSCLELIKGCEDSLLVHAAGLIHPKIFTKNFHTVNVRGSLNILNAATTGRISRLIVISSNSPIGNNPSTNHRFTETSPFNPYMGYGKSKALMEQSLISAMNCNGYPEITILRPPWFYGPAGPQRQLDFFRMIKQGHFPLMGKGLNKRSMVHVDNLVRGALLASDSINAINETYWIADENPYSMLEIINTIKSVLKEDFGLNVSKKNLHVPSSISSIARFGDAALQSLGLYNQKIHVLSEMNQTIACDISKAKQELNYIPKYQLLEGMRNCIEWHLKRGDKI